MTELFIVLLHLAGHVYVSANPPSSQTPPMGWISWNKFGCQRDCFKQPESCIGNHLIRRTADSMVKLGLRDLGYRFVILDNCWEAGPRDQISLEYTVSESQFPKGIRAISQYVREQDMSFGLLFTETCDGRNFMEADARTAAKYELDFVKTYGCSSDRFDVLRKAIKGRGLKPILSCAGPKIQYTFTYEPDKMDWSNLIRSCDIWRITNNNTVDWGGMLTVLSAWRKSSELYTALSGPKHWADLGTLGIGNVNLSPEQQRSQMAMWCLLASPLFISVDFDSLEQFSLNLLKNRLLIDINQDPAGRAPRYVKSEGWVQYWTRELYDQGNTWVIAFLNENYAKIKINVRLIDMGIRGIDTNAYYYTMTDVFSGNKTTTVELWQPIPVELNPYDTQMYIVEFVLSRKSKQRKKKPLAATAA